MITRLPNWEVKLTECIQAHRHSRFEWGKFDCALFVCDCIKAMTGTDLAAEYRGTYNSALGAVRIMNRFPMEVRGLADNVARRAGIQAINPIITTRGDVVLVKQEKFPALGIVWASEAAVTDNGVELTGAALCAGEGLQVKPGSDWLRAWRIG